MLPQSIEYKQHVDQVARSLHHGAKKLELPKKLSGQNKGANQAE
jgi:hypothetical protein